jgi:hypothetical protein
MLRSLIIAFTAAVLFLGMTPASSEQVDKLLKQYLAEEEQFRIWADMYDKGVLINQFGYNLKDWPTKEACEKFIADGGDGLYKESLANFAPIVRIFATQHPDGTIQFHCTKASERAKVGDTLI